MYLAEISLRNYRNISHLRLTPSAGLNLLIGPNAQGKTNVVEAIGLISTGHSFRTQEYRDLIQWQEVASEVTATASADVGSDVHRVLLTEERKERFRNEKRANIRTKGGVLTVLFAPEEILLLKGSPSARRHYLDTLIAQLQPVHRALVSQYEKVVRQRNRLLQDATLSQANKSLALAPWDEQLVDLGARLIAQRAWWCSRLAQFLPVHYEAIAPSDGAAGLVYSPHCGEAAREGGIPTAAACLRKQLQIRSNDEFVRGTTLVGPHRDDVLATLGPTPVKHFGSQGQHRSFVLALKMAEMDLMREVTGEEPILLLDDVASELDIHRNRHFFEQLQATRGQVFVTATREEDVRIAFPSSSALFDVRDGTVVARK